MIQAVKKQFQVQWSDWIWMTAMIVGASLAGGVLHWFIIKSDETTDTCFALGTVMALMMVLIFSIIMTFTQLHNCFNVQISMGSTRSQFYVSYYVFCAVFDVVSIIVVMGINVLETYLLKIIYPGYPNEIDFMPYLVKFGLPIAVFLPIVTIFCGALMMRFGRKIFWIFWAIWMISCLGIPTIVEHAEEAPNTLYGKIGTIVIEFFSGISMNVWVLLAAAVVLISFAGSWMLIRRQQVTS